jgi:hypothetical protein
MKSIHYPLACLLLLLISFSVNAQINIPDTSPVTENFDAIGPSPTASLPVNWKMSPAGTIAPLWDSPDNLTSTNFAFSSGSPTGTGGRYNWGKTGDADRSIGVISSQSYFSPNSIMAWYRNTGTDNINTLTISYDLFQFRINTATPVVTFYYSTDGSTWTHVTAGDAQAITTGAGGYNFSNPVNFGRSADAGTSAFSIKGLSIPVNGDIYLRWEVKTVGSSSSEGLGLDNVQLTAKFGAIVSENGITSYKKIKETFDEVGLPAIAALPSNWKMSPPGSLSPSWSDPNNFTSTTFAASSGSPVTGGKYNWGQTGDTDRAIGFISSQSYLSQNSVMAWYTNADTKTLTSLTVSYDLYQFRINTAQPVVSLYYSTDGSSWIPFSPGDAQPITTGSSAYTFSNPPNFGRSVASGTSAFTITDIMVPPGGNVYLRWNFKTVGSSSSEGLGLDNVEIIGGTGAAVSRGPYMNVATQTGIIIRWRTNIPTDSRVRFGLTPQSFSDSVSDPVVTKEHIVQLNNLTPNTEYYYSVGSSTEVLQGDGNNYFKTLPVTGSTQKVRILAMGDMGTNSTAQRNVRDAYLNYNGSNYTDVWLLVGDNAYESGLDSEYQTNFFNIYQGSLTKNHVLWPSPGNHEYGNNAVLAEGTDVPYYSIFSTPTNGEAGGVPSGTKQYYSYNYGNIHFISLQSYAEEESNTAALFDTTSAQAEWLKQDLAANTQKWTVVYFHYPPYSKGGSNSDTDPIDFRIRNKIVPILERYKVDLVITGHSHDYERTFLINGHYGLSNTFDTTTMAISSSSGKYDGSPNSAPYIKNSTDTRNGIVYALTGSSGQVTGSTASGYPHHAMQYSNITDPGCMVIEVEDNRLDAKWICSDGVTRDNFTIMKDVNKIIDTTVSYGSSITLTASWIGNYVWSNGETTRSITVNPSGDISYTVGDGLNALKDSFHVVVTNQPQLVASATAETINCNGSTTTVIVTATGGAAPYTGTGDFTVSAGTYNYTITDAKGNTATATITVDEPAALVVSSNAGSILCNGETTTVTISATGGTAPYTGEGNFTVTAGSYNYTVTDANGCTGTTSITVNQPESLTANAAAGVVTCNGGTTTVAVNATGGTAPYTGEGNFAVAAGNYNYSITDANGCTGTTSITVNQPDPLTANAAAGVITCNGGTATVTVNATGGTAPYTGEGNFTVAAGSYDYAVTDANGCINTTSVTINQPDPLTANATADPITEAGGTTTVLVTANGGTAPYTGTGNFTISSGAYNYTITDANNCIASTSISVEKPGILTATAVGEKINCNGGTTTVTVSATGGIAPYSGTGIFTVGAGTYNYTITDAKGNTATANVTVSEPSPFSAESVTTDILCNSGNSTITVTATGGTEPYAGTGNFTVGAGTYNYTVSDANGCSANTSVTVNQPEPLVANASAGLINCFGGNTTATVNASGGTAPYSGTGNFAVSSGIYNYTITDANGCTASTSLNVIQPDVLNASATAGTINCNGGTTNVAVEAKGGTLPYTGIGNFEVSAGTYTYTITDANGCNSGTSVTVSQLGLLNATSTADPINCYGGTTTIKVDATGGVAPYTGTGNFSVGAGVYNYTVTDANGCSTTTSATIDQPFTAVSAKATAGTINCFGGTTTVAVTATGGTAPYTGTGNFTVSAGTYSYSILDSKGCTATTPSVTITQPATTVKASSTAGTIICNGGTTAVSVTATGGVAPYTGTGNFTVAAGTYNYTVTDAKGCNGSTSITVNQPTAVKPSATYGAIKCNGNTTTVTVSATGGISPYTGTGNFSVRAGTYSYTVKDSKGCSGNTSITVSQPASIGINIAGNIVNCYGGTTTITVNATGGTPPYSYSMLFGLFYQTSNTFTNLKAGSYSVSVKDANGCISSKTFTITQPGSALSLTIVKNTAANCKGGANGSIQVSSSGGTSPYQYSLNNGSFGSTGTFNNLKAGTYTVTVKDAKGCTTSKSVTVKDGTRRCTSLTSTQSSISLITTTLDESKTLYLTASPNPSLSDFTLTIQSGSIENVEITVTDVFGRKMLQTKGGVSQSYVFGKDFTSGLYIVQVRQGNNIKTLKLIKGK